MRFASPVRPPKFRIFDGYWDKHLVIALVQFRLVLDFLTVTILIGDVQQQIGSQLLVCLNFHFHLRNPRTTRVA